MATVEKRGKSWSVRYVVKDAFGNIIGQKRKSGFATKSDAMAAAKELEQATARGVNVHGDQMTCGEIMEAYFDARVKEESLKKTSLAAYSYSIDRLKEHSIYQTKVINLQKSSLGTLCQELKDGDDKHGQISATTVRNYIRPLIFALKWAAREGMIMKNPFAHATLPKAAKRDQVIITEADIHDLVTKCQETDHEFLTPLYLALYGGLCREESAGLTWKNVDLDHGFIRVKTVITAIKGKEVAKDPKTEYRERTIKMPEFTMQHLRAQEHTNDRVCINRKGKPYGPEDYSRHVKSLIRKVNADREKDGKELVPKATYHDLRHTHAAMLIAMGIQPKVISDRLGHANIGITMDLYGYLMPGLQEQVADELEKKFG